MNELWTDTGAFSLDAGGDPFQPEPFVITPPKPPPCDSCQHFARCARDNLACCAFAAYLAKNGIGARWEHRDPSPEWGAYVERDAEREKAPRCPHCINVISEGREKARIHRGLILELLAERPGMLVSEIADALNATHRSMERAVLRLSAEGKVVSERGKRGIFGRHIVRWSLARG